MRNPVEGVGMALEHVSEESSTKSEGERPDQDAGSVEGDEGAVRHGGLPRDGRGNATQSGNEFGQQKGSRSMLGEVILGAANAGGTLHGEPAEQLDDRAPIALAHDVPKAV